MAIVHRPLHVSELARLADLPSEADPVAIIKKCRSLDIHLGVVKFVNPEARYRAVNDLHSKPSKLSEAHSLVARKCLQFLSEIFQDSEKIVSGLDSNWALSRKSGSSNSYEIIHWLIHLCNVKEIIKSVETMNSLISFMQRYFLLWLNTIISEGLHHDAAILMKKLERLMIAQSKQEILNQPKRKIFKYPKDQRPALPLLQDALRFLDSHISGDTNFPFNPCSILFSPNISALKRGWTQFGSDACITWTHHEKCVQSVAFCPLGERLASASDDKTVRIWDLEDGAAELTITYDDPVACLAFSPIGSLAICSYSSSCNVIDMWRLSDAHCYKNIWSYGLAIRALQFSPDCDQLLAGTDDALLLWDISKRKSRKVMELSGYSYPVSFIQQGTQIVCSGRTNDIHILDAKNDYTPLRTLQGHTNKVTSIALLRDETCLISGSLDSTVKIWSRETGEVLKTFSFEQKIFGISLSPDDSLIAVASDKIRLLDGNTGEQKHTIEGHAKDVRTVAFSPQGLLASGSDDMTVRLWDLDDMYPTEYDGMGTKLMAMSSDGKYLASSSETEIYLWDAITGQPTEHHKLLQAGVKFIVFSPDGERLLSANDDIVMVWDVKKGTLCQTFRGHTGRVYSAAFSPDGNYIASGSSDGTVRIWNCLAENEEEAMILRDHKDKFLTVAFSPDGRLLAIGGSSKKFMIWDRTTLQLKHEVYHHHGHILNSIIFTQDSFRILSRSATRSAECSVSVWDSHTGACIQGPITIKNISRYIGFDLRIPEYILTEFGVDPSTLDSNALFNLQSINGKRYGTSAAGDWITWNGRKLIPLPEEYHNAASWVQGNIVAIGVNYDQVLLFRFSPDEEPPNW
ncbi:WD40-repeat-containing domain protein [Trichoderma chlorosporum]